MLRLLALTSFLTTALVAADFRDAFERPASPVPGNAWSPLDTRGLWSVSPEGALIAMVSSGGSESFLAHPSAPTSVDADHPGFVVSVDLALLVARNSRFAGLAVHTQPNGDTYLLRHTAAGLIQFIRKSGGQTSLLGQSSARFRLGETLRFTVRSSQPGVFSWHVAGEERRFRGEATDPQPPLTGGLAALWTNATPEQGQPVVFFDEFWFSPDPSAYDPRPAPAPFSNAPSAEDLAALRAAADASQATTVSAWLLTWREDPTTTQIIDWHQAGQNAASPFPFAWRRVGDPAWQNRTPDESLPFPHSSRHIHRVALSGLTPDTLYEFRLGSEQPLSFRTLPARLDRPVSFAIGGDMMGNPAVYEQINRTVAHRDPAFIVWGGDLAYADGRPDNVNRWFQYLEIASRSLLTADRRVLPMIVAIGNHEVNGGFWWNTRFGREGWPGTDAARAEVAPFFYSLFAFPGHPGYGVIDVGDYASFVILDTEHTTPVAGPQTDWLRSTFAARPRVPHLIPVYHVPAYPSHRPFEGGVSRNIREHWVPLFEQSGLRLAFEHHDHTYKRTHPLRGGQPHPEGIIYAGDGNWGIGSRIPDPSRPYLAVAEPRYHAFMVTLHPDRAEVEAVAPDGEVFDRFSAPSRR